MRTAALPLHQEELGSCAGEQPLSERTARGRVLRRKAGFKYFGLYGVQVVGDSNRGRIENIKPSHPAFRF